MGQFPRTAVERELLPPIKRHQRPTENKIIVVNIFILAAKIELTISEAVENSLLVSDSIAIHLIGRFSLSPKQ